MSRNEHESLLAHYYDLEYSDYRADVDFYRQYALALDPGKALPVLELGCGTGRILLDLAKAGFSVTGVDSSAEMLGIARVHVEGGGVQDRVRLVPGDMRHPVSRDGSRFNMAFCALNTFAYLRTTDDQLSMLRAVKESMVRHGLLILDLTPPWPDLLPPEDGEVVYQGAFHDPETGGTLHKLVTGRAEPSTQTHQVRLLYDLERPDGALSRVSKEETFRWTGRYEMELLLRTGGYTVEQLYGDYDLNDFEDHSERMIFVARA